MAAVSFKYYQDPGHGWIAVKLKTLNDLGLNPWDFTSYSYMKGQTVYLEEDSDASKFIETWIKHFGEEPALVRKNTNKSSPIRSYPHIMTRGG